MREALVRRALPRAAVHAGLGILFAAAILLLPRLAVVTALAVLAAGFLVFDLTRLRLPLLGRYFSVWFAPVLRRTEGARLTGASYFLIGCVICAAVFSPEMAALAVAFLALGDPAATVFGLWKGRTMLWGRSLEGDAACLLVCLGTAFIAVALLDSPPMIVAAAGAAAASLFQALRLPLNDNLTIPVGSGIMMALVNALV